MAPYPVTGEKYARRFWLRVNKTDSCWHWMRALNKAGYGQVGYMGGQLGAHQVAWILTNGPIPPGKFVCHVEGCLRHCVRPDHLWLGTNKENQISALQAGKIKIGEQSPIAKLGDEEIRLIRVWHANGLTARVLADCYNITPEYVRMLVRGSATR